MWKTNVSLLSKDNLENLKSAVSLTDGTYFMESEQLSRDFNVREGFIFNEQNGNLTVEQKEPWIISDLKKGKTVFFAFDEMDVYYVDEYKIVGNLYLFRIVKYHPKKEAKSF